MRDRDNLLQARLRFLGQRVRALREGQKLSQEVLAERARLHRTYIGSVERGERNLALGNVYALADALAVTVDQLLDSTHPERPMSRGATGPPRG